MELDFLRQQHGELIYESFSYQLIKSNQLEISFNFILTPNLHFKPTIILTVPPNINLKQFESYIFHIGLVELLSYWKLACPALITIKAGYLNEEQIKWWHKLLIHSMGEFFYKNQIDFTSPDFVSFKVDSVANFTSEPFDLQNSSLVMVGGGKDSAVSLALLSEHQLHFDSLLINPTDLSIQMSGMSKVKSAHIIHRTLDPLLIDLNQSGYLNGHTPFSALLAFIGVFVSAINHHRYLIASNEFSSNEGNTQYLGWTINHQYTKTYEFEIDFQKYVTSYLHPKQNYFSLLRPFFELQISRIFATKKSFFPIIRSCNVNQRQSSWCGHCPKCLTVFASIYPFVSATELSQIFPTNLFQDEQLFELAKQLTGQSETKPFECVGTKEESLIAFYLAVQKHKQENIALPSLLQLVDKHILSPEKNLETRTLAVLNQFNAHHSIPNLFLPLITNLQPS